MVCSHVACPAEERAATLVRLHQLQQPKVLVLVFMPSAAPALPVCELQTEDSSLCVLQKQDSSQARPALQRALTTEPSPLASAAHIYGCTLFSWTCHTGASGGHSVVLQWLCQHDASHGQLDAPDCSTKPTQGLSVGVEEQLQL